MSPERSRPILFGIGCVAIPIRPVGVELGRRIAEHFIGVLQGAWLNDDAVVEALQARRLRTRRHERRGETPGTRPFRRVLGGLLLQERDLGTVDRKAMKVVCGTPNEQQWADLLFAWRVCKHAYRRTRS